MSSGLTWIAAGITTINVRLTNAEPTVPASIAATTTVATFTTDTLRRFITVRRFTIGRRLLGRLRLLGTSQPGVGAEIPGTDTTASLRIRITRVLHTG